MKKKYTLTFFVNNNGKEILEKVNCDQWIEVAEGSNALIYCLHENKDFSVGYPSSNLRKVIQNHGVLSYDCNINEEPLAGYI